MPSPTAQRRSSGTGFPSVGLEGALLRPDQGDAAEAEAVEEETTLLLRDVSAETSSKYRKHPQRKSVLVLMCILIIVVDIGGVIGVPALTQIFENDVCRQHYGLYHNGTATGDLADYDCKINPVLKEVSTLNGIKDAVEMVPGMALAIPYGLLADRIGRKPILALGVFTIVVNEAWFRVISWFWWIFPTRLVWLGPVAFLFGGGPPVVTSLIFTITADVFPQEQRANVFFLMLSCMLISTIIAAPIGALLTQTSPWGASFLSFGIILFGTSGVLALPETLDRGLVVESEEDPGLRERLARAFEGGIKKTMARTLHLGRTCYKATAFIWHSRNITLLLFTFFIGHLGKQSVVVMVLYGSRKFGWSIGEASNIITLTAIANLISFLVLPLITKAIVRRYNLSGPVKDLVLSEGQNVLLIVGMLTVGISSTPWTFFIGAAIFGLGSGYVASVRSLITSLVPQNNLATLYTSITTIQSIGAIVAGPMQAAVFNEGIDLGGHWLGMPFMMASGLYLTSMAALLYVRLPKGDDPTEEAADLI